MRVVVTGLVATYPLGGVALDYLQYVMGFRALGLEVYYLEDTGQWLYDPALGTFTADASGGARYLARLMAAIGPDMERRWSLRGPGGERYGLGESKIASVCAGADLFLNVSGSCWLREPYRACRVTAYLDTDPGYSQAKLAAVDAGAGDRSLRYSAALIRSHTCFFTVGENLGRENCTVPVCGIEWRRTRHPIVLEAWPVRFTPAAPAYTTVLSWRIEPEPPLIAGRRYGGKDVELLRFADLPRMVPAALELAISGPAPRGELMAHGWRITDAAAISRTPDDYREYLGASRGEVSVAKEVYVATCSGWFSSRSAAYLAMGKPVVLEDTGFSSNLPVGEGLYTFSSAEEAAGAIEAIERDYARACRRAREIAEAHFAASRVLGRLLADAGF